MEEPFPHGWAHLDGRRVPAAEALVSIFDHGLLYGYGLFETVRVYRGVPFRLGAHLARLEAGAALLEIPLAWPPNALADAVADVIAANGFGDAALRITVTRGPGAAGPDPDPRQPATRFVFARRWSPPPASLYGRGAHAIVAEVRQNEASPLARIKSLNYGVNLLARAEARAAGAAEALLLNRSGTLASGATSNLFAVTGGQLVTPPPDDGCLPGITRAVVFELAEAAGIAVAERSLALADLLAADEAFLTNSLREIVPLVRVDDATIGAGIPGPVTQALLAAYRALVARETGG